MTKDKQTTPQLAPKDPDEMNFQVISTDLIDDPEKPIRTDLTPASVEDLVISIKQVGIIEPLVVRPRADRYEVIAGHRRLYAAKLAKIATVPCYVRKATDEQTEMLKIHENLYRTEVNPVDEALFFNYLIQEKKLTPVKIANLITKSPQYVHDRLQILEYPDFLREAVKNKEITFAVAREFYRFGDEQQMKIATYYAKRSGMTTALARKWVNEYKQSKQQQQIKEEVKIDTNTQKQVVEHTTQCIYCLQGLRLIDAVVVYMHPDCYNKVLQPDTTPAEQT